MITPTASIDAIIIFIVLFIFNAGIFYWTAKNSIVVVGKLENKIDKIDDKLSSQSTKVDIVQHDVNALRERESGITELLKNVQQTSYENKVQTGLLDKRINMLEQKVG